MKKLQSIWSNLEKFRPEYTTKCSPRNFNYYFQSYRVRHNAQHRICNNFPFNLSSKTWQYFQIHKFLTFAYRRALFIQWGNNRVKNVHSKYSSGQYSFTCHFEFAGILSVWGLVVYIFWITVDQKDSSMPFGTPCPWFLRDFQQTKNVKCRHSKSAKISIKQVL